MDSDHLNIIEAVFKAGKEERINDKIARKVDDVDKALLNSGAKVITSEREKTSKLLSIEKNRLVADQATPLPNLPLGHLSCSQLFIALIPPQFTLFPFFYN